MSTFSARLSAESRLVNDIQDKYRQLGNTAARPKINSSETLQVHFGLRLITLDVDEEQQTLTTSAWIRCVSLKKKHLPKEKNETHKKNQNHSRRQKCGFKILNQSGIKNETT